MTDATPKLYAHPPSSYWQKALTTYENDIAFDYRLLDGSEPVASMFAKLWPIGRFPIPTDDERLVTEATTIVEYLDVAHPGPTRFVPGDADDRLLARPSYARVFDEARPYRHMFPLGAPEGRD